MELLSENLFSLRIATNNIGKQQFLTVREDPKSRLFQAIFQVIKFTQKVL